MSKILKSKRTSSMINIKLDPSHFGTQAISDTGTITFLNNNLNRLNDM